MNIAVCIKQTIDTEANIVVDAEGRVVTEGQTLVIDPYSEFAVERAVQLTEEHGGEVAVVCIGGEESLPAVRHALSMGAHAGYLLDDPVIAGADSAAKARILAAALTRVSADVVLGGCKSADTSNAQTMPRVAELLGLPCVQVVTALEVDFSANTAHATRELDDGVALIDVSLPVIITAQQGLAEPRYPNVRAIMQSKKKLITTWSLVDLDIEASRVAPEVSCTRTVRFRTKPRRQGGQIVKADTTAEAVAMTMELLASDAKVI